MFYCNTHFILKNSKYYDFHPNKNIRIIKLRNLESGTEKDLILLLLTAKNNKNHHNHYNQQR